MTPPILSAENLFKYFPVSTSLFDFGEKKFVRAVDGVELSVAPGETFALVGESGCGKSTLSRLLVGLLSPTKGAVNLNGQRLDKIDHRQRCKTIQMIFQDPLGSLNSRKSIRNIIGRPLDVHGFPAARREERIRELLSLVRLDPEVMDRYPHEFSGGQQQRIAIARALAPEPAILVADEPVSALDVSVQAQIVALLTELKAKMNLTLIMISHDLALVNYIADRVAVMYLGRVVEMGTVTQIFDSPLHPYTVGLLGSTGVPDPARRGKPALIRGEIPSPINVPSGCRFRTRCPQRMPICETVDPELSVVAGKQRVACHLYSQSMHSEQGKQGNAA